MWIRNEFIERFLNGTADNWDREHIQARLEESKEREERRRKERQERNYDFFRSILAIFKDYPTQEFCPTDIQFILFQRTGQKVACQKVAHALKSLYIGREGYPDDLYRKLNFTPWWDTNHRNNQRSYYRYNG